MSGFDRRGDALRLVTTETAELDIALLGLSEAEVNGIARSLRQVGLSDGDVMVAPLFVRTIGDLEVGYTRALVDGVPTLTVFSIKDARPGDPVARALKGLEVVAMLRRVFGL